MSHKKLRRLLIKLKLKKIIYNIKLNEQNKIINIVNAFSKMN